MLDISLGWCATSFVDKHILESFLVISLSIFDGLCGLLEVHISAAEWIISVGKVKVHAERQGIKLLHDNECNVLFIYVFIYIFTNVLKNGTRNYGILVGLYCNRL